MSPWWTTYLKGFRYSGIAVNLSLRFPLFPFAQLAGIRGDEDKISALEAFAMSRAQHKHMIIQRRFIFSQEVVHHRIIPFLSLATRNEDIASSIWMCERGDITFEKPPGGWSRFGDRSGWQQ
jgi:hypothetical protein